MGLLRPSKSELLLRIQELETTVQRVSDDNRVLTSKLTDLRVKIQGHDPQPGYSRLVETGLRKPLPKSGMEGEMEALEAYINACIQNVRKEIREHVESRVLHPELVEKDSLTRTAAALTKKAEEIQ